MIFELIAPCHFGMEAVLKREIIDLGYEIASVEDGKVTFIGDEEAVCRANIWLRTTERILIKAAKFKAETFDELFERTKEIPWENYIPKNGKFWVAKATSIKSKLFSPSDIQSIIKKAMVERLKNVYHVEWFEEDGEEYPIRVTFMKDEITFGIDTSGDSLHKRGYRKVAGKAPLTETLASAMILLCPWRKERFLVDPFCGSGTIPIEAAMIGANIAPGLERGFTADRWPIVPKKYWDDAYEEARESINMDVEMNIQGYDIDDDMIKIARNNAQIAKVDKFIHFQQRPLAELSSTKKYGFIITNPPYGERLEEKDAMPALYRQIGDRLKLLDTWSSFIISGYEDAQKYIGKKADKNRKIYNGMMKTYLYQYMGPRPPKQDKGR